MNALPVCFCRLYRALNDTGWRIDRMPPITHCPGPRRLVISQVHKTNHRFTTPGVCTRARLYSAQRRSQRARSVPQHSSLPGDDTDDTCNRKTWHQAWLRARWWIYRVLAAALVVASGLLAWFCASNATAAGVNESRQVAHVASVTNTASMTAKPSASEEMSRWLLYKMQRVRSCHPELLHSTLEHGLGQSNNSSLTRLLTKVEICFVLYHEDGLQGCHCAFLPNATLSQEI